MSFQLWGIVLCCSLILTRAMLNKECILSWLFDYPFRTNLSLWLLAFDMWVIFEELLSVDSMDIISTVKLLGIY